MTILQPPDGYTSIPVPEKFRKCVPKRFQVEAYEGEGSKHYCIIAGVGSKIKHVDLVLTDKELSHYEVGKRIIRPAYEMIDRALSMGVRR